MDAMHAPTPKNKIYISHYIECEEDIIILNMFYWPLHKFIYEEIYDYVKLKKYNSKQRKVKQYMWHKSSHVYIFLQQISLTSDLDKHRILH